MLPWYRRRIRRAVFGTIALGFFVVFALLHGCAMLLHSF
jgi:hypothetical protein